MERWEGRSQKEMKLLKRVLANAALALVEGPLKTAEKLPFKYLVKYS